MALLQRTVERILSRVSLAIRFMAVLSLGTGALVLLGAVAAGRLERIREGALLKALGATRLQIERILLSEYLALGALAALVGIGLASGGGGRSRTTCSNCASPSPPPRCSRSSESPPCS